MIHSHNYSSTLFSAINNNSLKEAELLIEQGAEIDLQNLQGNTPVSYAIIRNQMDIATLLIRKGANLELRNNNGGTPLLFAITKNQIKKAKLLMDNGANVNTSIENGSTLIAIAMIKKHTQIAKLLIHYGANFELANESGSTPLISSVKKRDIDYAKLLIKQGAKVSEEDEVMFLRYDEIYGEISALASVITEDIYHDLTDCNLNPYQLAAIALDLAQTFDHEAIEIAAHIINNPDITRLFLLHDHVQIKLLDLVKAQTENLEATFTNLCKIINNLELYIEPSSNNLDVINKAFEIAVTLHENHSHIITPSDCKTFANLLNLLLNPNLLEQQYGDLNALCLTSKAVNNALGGEVIFESSSENAPEYPRLDGLSSDVIKIIGTHITANFNVVQLPEISSLLKLHQQAGYQPQNNIEDKVRLERTGNVEKEEITSPRENNSQITTATEESTLSRAVNEAIIGQGKGAQKQYL